jgi:Holliday junction resolvase RusA-like endonuclease
MKPINKAQWEIIILPGCIKITIPENMPSLNVWKNWHWAKQGRHKEQLTQDLRFLWHRIARPAPLEKARIGVVHYFPTSRRRDEDNYTPKFLGDALKGAGFIAEDNSEVLTWLKPIFRKDASAWRTEIFIYEEV